MDQGFKHFSHLHNLIMHQMPQGIQVSCSACHSSATGILYVCGQCNFFLHDQCYRATRSLKHPSHPTHPLTLVPCPTYPSNSFYCNSCQSIGTGFSYSCADCEFDLHVQCAYSISGATSLKNAHQFQELVPQGWNGVPNSNMDHHVPFAFDPSVPQNRPPVSIPTSSHNSSAEYPSVAQTGPSIPIPTDYPQNPIPSAQDPSITQNKPVSIPTSSDNSIAQDPSMAQSYSILDAQAELQRLQLQNRLAQQQLQLAKQSAKFMASCGASLASLA
ncbi:putative chromatin regulator PHD family [Helianthus annuus]|nr:putative chromatin regulator PHD family [Helianthus annuus]